MSQIKLLHSGGNGVILAAPTNNPASDVTFKLPQADGTSGQALTTNASGQLAFATVAGGKVLQIQSANNSTQLQITSTSFVTTGLTVNITPTSASSKILITTGFDFYKSSSSATGWATLYRDSTNLGNATYGMGALEGFGGAGSTPGVNLQYLDTPNTTSQVTYTVYAKVNSGHNLYVQGNNVPSNITVWEYST